MRKLENKFLFWRVLEWRTSYDGGVNFYSFGRLTDCKPIHRWIMRRKKWIL